MRLSALEAHLLPNPSAVAHAGTGTHTLARTCTGRPRFPRQQRASGTDTQDAAQHGDSCLTLTLNPNLGLNASSVSKVLWSSLVERVRVRVHLCVNAASQNSFMRGDSGLAFLAVHAVSQRCSRAWAHTASRICVPCCHLYCNFQVFRPPFGPCHSSGSVSSAPRR